MDIIMQNPQSLSGIKLKDGKEIEGAPTLVGQAPASYLTKRHPKEPSEHAIMLSKGIEVPCLVDGVIVRIVIKPFKFNQLDEVIEVVAPLNKKLENLAKSREEAFNLVKDSQKLLTFVKTNRVQIYKFMGAFHKDLTPEFLGELDLGAVAELLLTIITVNIDFFMQEIAPNLQETLTAFAVEVIPKLGKTRSGS